MVHGLLCQSNGQPEIYEKVGYITLNNDDTMVGISRRSISTLITMTLGHEASPKVVRWRRITEVKRKTRAGTEGSATGQ